MNAGRRRLFDASPALMAWIIISANGDEIDRRELSGAVVIGRSPECDIAVRDLLLSRTHCRLEPVGQGWKVVDLNSKNGTRVGWQGVQTHGLRGGDHLRMGRTRIVFHVGPFEPAPERAVRINRIIRPADPHEALTGTVTDFVLLDDEQPSIDEEVDYGSHPFPQPRPSEPALREAGAAATNDADPPSSSWCSEDQSDSAGGTALMARPQAIVRALPRFPLNPVYRQIPRQARNVTDLSLQADPILIQPESLPVITRTRKQRLLAITGLALAALMGTGIVVMSIWLLTLAP
jgi:predicted component of type VI protein secretion system